MKGGVSTSWLSRTGGRGPALPRGAVVTAGGMRGRPAPSAPPAAPDFSASAGPLGALPGHGWADTDTDPPHANTGRTYGPRVRDLVVQSDFDPGRALLYALLDQACVREL